MGRPTPDVFVAVFEDASRAEHVHEELTGLERGGLIALLATAVIRRDPDGEVEWRMRGQGTGHICSRADTIATMLGILLPTPVVVAGLTAASLAGEGGEDAEREFAERFAREIASAVEPGGSIFIGLVEDRWVTELERGLRGYHRLTGRRS